MVWIFTTKQGCTLNASLQRHSKLWNCSCMLRRAQSQFVGQTHKNCFLRKTKNLFLGVIFGFTHFICYCVTVINNLLTQNTKLQWFTWANYTMYYCMSVSRPSGQSVSVHLWLSHSHILPYTPTAKKGLFFFPAIQLGLKLFLIQSPSPIHCKPSSLHSLLSAEDASFLSPYQDLLCWTNSFLSVWIFWEKSVVF